MCVTVVQHDADVWNDAAAAFVECSAGSAGRLVGMTWRLEGRAAVCRKAQRLMAREQRSPSSITPASTSLARVRK